MYWYIYFMVLILVCLQMVSSQVSVSYTYEEETCTEKITLKCTYTGGTNCCSASTRLWFKNDIPILSDGASTPVGKYSEIDIKPSDKQFSLVINDFGEGDTNAEYKCSYALTTSTAYNLKDDSRYTEKCPPTPKCGGHCLGCDVTGFVPVIIIEVVVIKSIKLIILSKIAVCVTGAIVTFAPSLVLSFCLSFCICTWNWYPCDSTSLPWVWFPLGLGISILYFLFTCHIFKERLYIGKMTNKDDIALEGSFVVLVSNLRAEIGTGQRVIWNKNEHNLSQNKNIGTTDKNLQERLEITGDHKSGEYNLKIWNIKKTDQATYYCTISGTDIKHQKELFVIEDATTGSDVIFYIVTLFTGFLAVRYLKSKLRSFREANHDGSGQSIPFTGGKSQSVESGSSCWPICRVGQDPNTSSSGPEKVRSSPPKKQKPEKKMEEKPTEVVRPLPMATKHLKTENKEKTTYSAEDETFSDSLDKSSKQRPLPSITSKSSRPLPQRPSGDQQDKGGIKLEPLQDVGESSPEKKKKKKRKKKETKQSDNSTDF